MTNNVKVKLRYETSKIIIFKLYDVALFCYYVSVAQAFTAKPSTVFVQTKINLGPSR